MKLTINGKEKTFKAPLDIQSALETEGYGDKLVAVALNGVFVPKRQYNETILRDSDSIEILAPMQGG